MSILNSGRNDQDDQDVLLGMPDQSEAQSLDRHVERCSLRYRVFTTRLKNQGQATKRIEYILYGVAVWLFATSPFAQEMIKGLLGVK